MRLYTLLKTGSSRCPSALLSSWRNGVILNMKFKDPAEHTEAATKDVGLAVDD